MAELGSVAGKVVLITGASSGIGEGTALYLARAKCRLSLTGRKLERLQEVSKKCQELGLPEKDIFIIVGDMEKDGDIKNILDKTVEYFGKLDSLVNNAGGGTYVKTMDTSLAVFDNTMAVNVRAPFYLTQLAVPYLIKTQGSIINISSISGQRAFQGATAYCMSKAALDHFSRILAMELAKDKVRVNIVSPGVIITDFQKRAGMSDERYVTYLQEQDRLQPLGGPGTPEQVAKIIKFLISDESGFVTGENIHADGGRHVLAPQ
ncbi:3-oxoacyl-[acyl-carrier-protein] reductase FabG [Patella vulgata]|uniref:3-oxoacyl-[acyl-carrier-protein] reductase FabG n=1 Tax=Patella vulgata TaxID=6465 RepID=UPI0024A7E6A7|nr:3-oxoacyl-[acyl-carrier-protein] reductase FabG [Patella vulgata]